MIGEGGRRVEGEIGEGRGGGRFQDGGGDFRTGGLWSI